MTPPRTLADLVDLAHALVTGSARVVLGVSGAPGAGKSTLARALVDALAAQPPTGMPSPDWVVLVPMDGFHLADVELHRLGLHDRKGAPETFDAAGYAALLARVAADDGETVYAPSFARDLDQPVAGAIPVTPQTRLVVTEGNYLLLDTGAWPRVRSHLTQVWHCAPEEQRRRAQLVTRHTAYGKDPEVARRWALGPDESNAALVGAAAHRADLVIGEDLLWQLPTGRRAGPD